VISVTTNTTNGMKEHEKKANEIDGNGQSSLSSSSPKHDNTRTQFGGDRNPNNTIFVFDVSYCSANELIGVALSDGTLRVLNTSGLCVSVLHLPDNQSHLTSLSWNSTGTCLATCVGTGHLVTWKVHVISNTESSQDSKQLEEPLSSVQITWNAVFAGGHVPDTPLFGAKYLRLTDSAISETEDTKIEQYLISWGSDGKLCLWDSQAEGEIYAPISILLNQPDYPIYSVSIDRREAHDLDIQQSATIDKHCTVALTGGGTQGGFIGIPVYLYDV
jgi:WD40 repeat protein